MTGRPDNRLHRVPTVILVLAAALGPAACDTSPPHATVSDPREILARTIETTAGLASAHVRIDFQIRQAAEPIGEELAGFAEGDVDLRSGELRISGGAGAAAGAFGIVVLDGSFYAQSGGDRWMQMPLVGGVASPVLLLLGAGAGDPAPVEPLLVELVRDEATEVDLRGDEECPTGRCYRTTAGIGPDQVWPFAVRLFRLDELPGGPPEPTVGQVPAVALEVLTDVETLRLVEMTASTTMQGSSFAIRLQLSEPNVPVRIEPPPAHLVDPVGR